MVTEWQRFDAGHCCHRRHMGLSGHDCDRRTCARRGCGSVIGDGSCRAGGLLATIRAGGGTGDVTVDAYAIDSTLLGETLAPLSLHTTASKRNEASPCIPRFPLVPYKCESHSQLKRVW